MVSICRAMLNHAPVVTDGEHIREARIALGVTREELAVCAGIAGSTVARIERGDVQPTRGTMRLLDTALTDLQERTP